ncbi:DUF5959 family protein [Streptomyces sp. NPDC059718]
MTDEAQPLELFRFDDEGRSVSVRMEGGPPSVMGDDRYCGAEIVVESDFVSGRVRLVLSLEDLDAWGRCLDALACGHGVEWPPDERTAWLDIVPDDPMEVTVHDAPSTQVAVRVPIDVTEDWLEGNRLRLDRVRRAFG